MHAPRISRRHRTGIIILSTIGGIALSSTFVLQATSAAFTAQTSNAGNVVATSDVALSDNDAGSALFQVSDMNQGDVETRCIEVSYEGTTDARPVVLYSGGYTDSSTLGQYLNVDVLLANAGATCAAFAGASIFTGTLDVLDATHTTYANGLGGWDPAAASAATPETRAYRISIGLDTATPNSFSGESVSALTFTWEVQS